MSEIDLDKMTYDEKIDYFDEVEIDITNFKDAIEASLAEDSNANEEYLEAAERLFQLGMPPKDIKEFLTNLYWRAANDYGA